MSSIVTRILSSTVGLLWNKAREQRAFRIITRENYTTRSADILNKLGVQNLEKRRMQFNSHVQGEKQIGPRLLV